MSYGIVRTQVEDPGLYTVKLPGVDAPVEMWCCTADELAIGSKVAVADVDNLPYWDRDNILPNVGDYVYSDERSWKGPEQARGKFPASFALGYIYFDNWIKQCPLFKRDTITEIIDDNHVRLERYGASEPVEVQYMTCDAGIFNVDDYVLVRFKDNDWNKPLVVGFVKEPKYCYAPFWILGNQLDFNAQLRIGVNQSKQPIWPDPDFTTEGYLFQKWISNEECIVVGPRIAGSPYVSVLNAENGNVHALFKIGAPEISCPGGGPGSTAWFTWVYANGDPTNIWIVAWADGSCPMVLVQHWEKAGGEWSLTAQRIETDTSSDILGDGTSYVIPHRRTYAGGVYGNYIDNGGQVWVGYAESDLVVDEGIDVYCCAGYNEHCGNYGRNEYLRQAWGIGSVDVASWAKNGFPGFSSKIQHRNTVIEECRRDIPKQWGEGWSCPECGCYDVEPGIGCCRQGGFVCTSSWWSWGGMFINFDGTYEIMEGFHQIPEMDTGQITQCELNCPECTSGPDCHCCTYICFPVTDTVSCPDRSCESYISHEEWGFTPAGADDLYYCSGTACSVGTLFHTEYGGCRKAGGRRLYGVADRGFVDGYGFDYKVFWVEDYYRYHEPYYWEGTSEPYAVYGPTLAMMDTLGGWVDCGRPTLNPHPPSNMGTRNQNLAESLELPTYGYYYIPTVSCQSIFSDDYGNKEYYKGYLIGFDPNEDFFHGNPIQTNRLEPLAVSTWFYQDQLPWLIDEEGFELGDLGGYWVEDPSKTSQTSSSSSVTSTSSTSTSSASSSISSSTSSSSRSSTSSSWTTSISSVSSSVTGVSSSVTTITSSSSSSSII